MAAITPVASVEAFLNSLAKSGLLSAEAVAAARQTGAASDGPKSLARELVKSGALTKWQANQLLHGFHLLMIGKFKLLDQLGASDIGRVYLAEHAQIGRRHTLKVLAKRHLSNPQVVQRFLAEATQACGLDHRNISHVYDVSQDGDRCYMVMEYVEGEDLARLVERSGKLSAPQAVELVRQAAEGLAHAHESGVVHGDLKPSNLLLDAAGTLKILDLGQAGLRTLPGEADPAQNVATTAALAFRAPERRAGSDQPANIAGDIYSLGCVLCCLLIGKPAANSADAAGELAAAGVPGELALLCSRLLADEPGQRPGSMDAVLAGLASLGRLKSASPAKPPEAPAPKAKKPPVAKPLDSPPLPVARPLDAPAAAAPAAPAGLAIQPAAKGNKPPNMASPAAAPAKKGSPNRQPLVIAAAIGGGVLVLGVIGLLVVLLGFGPGDKPVAQAPKTDAPAATAPASETNPVESNPSEANPVESNPAAASPAEAGRTAPAAATPAGSTVVPTPPPGANLLAAAAPAAPLPAEPAPEPEPMPPAKAKTPPAKAAPKAKPKSAADPFAGFAKAITLPPLPAGTAPLTADAPAPQPLGPCQVDDQALVLAKLQGGDTAIRGGRFKFDLQSTNGTEPRDWEFQLLGGEAPVVVATLAAKEGKLHFAWTEAGVKQPAQSRLLCNCAINLTAGAGKHVVALREAVTGPPLGVDFEKNAAVKWTIDDLPDPKAIQIEATQFDGLARQKLVPDGPTAVGDDMLLWTGPADDAMFLCLKLLPTAQARGLQISSAPQVKMPGMPKAVRFSKKEATLLRQSADGTLAALTSKLNAVSKKRSAKKGDAIDVAKTQLQSQLDETHKGVAALDKLLTYVDSAKDGKIHFRVYYQAEDTQIDLLVTSGDAEK